MAHACTHTHTHTHTQGGTCLEGGVYMLNYAGCHKCQSKTFIDQEGKSREEEEDGNEECITYKRMFASSILDIPFNNYCCYNRNF